MRKMNIIMALALWPVMSCEPLEHEAPVSNKQTEELVCVSIQASGKTKSSMQISETAVANLNVYAYRNGLLDAEAYAADAGVEIRLMRDVSYRIYALANCGLQHAPLHENELASVSVAPSDMVMCLREGVQIVAGSFTGPLEIPLTRMFARYTLLLDKDLENCDYQITLVKVKQRATVLWPFAASAAAASTADGDSASAADLVSLNNGEGAVFYVPENCQGVLLPGNEDPWAKTPANIPAAKRGLCTYLHIEGSWTTSGATADLSVNLMLGADNCSDFNVVRNTSTVITLSMTDTGTLKSHWKVEMDNLSDDRVLYFPNASQTVMQGDWTRIPLTVSPPDMPYTTSFSGSGEPVMEAKVENGEVWVRNIYDGDQRPRRTLTVTSWDGRHTSSTEITLDFNYGPLTAFDYRLPHFTGEYGWFEFFEASASRPVIIEAADWTTTLGPARSENYEYHLDSHNGMEYHVFHNQHKMYIRPIRGDAMMHFDFTQYKTKVGVFVGTVANPQLIAGDGVVSESGCRCYQDEHDFFYDSSCNVYLADAEGTKLNISRFKIPSELLVYKGLSATDSGYYHDFFEYYGSEVEVQESANYGCHVIPWSDDGDLTDFINDSVFAKLYFYGTDDYGNSYPVFPMTARLPMGNGDILTATGSLTALPAFPSQRYLGPYYNYQLAPGAMRSLTTHIDFTSGGSCYAPGVAGITWTVNHADGSDYGIPIMAVEGGSSDSYSEGASLSGHTLSFRQMDQSTFPACGMLGLKGTVTNPYSGKTYSGYYTLELILYVPIGCNFSWIISNKVVIDYAPFTEYSVEANKSKWNSCFPAGVMIKAEYGSGNVYPLWDNGYIYSPVSAGGIPQSSTLEDVAAKLSQDMSKLRFSFKVGDNTYQELLLGRSSSVFFADDSWDSQGSHGYYHLVRQYDLGTFDHGDKYNGLENYLIEAAYESMTDY